MSSGATCSAGREKKDWGRCWEGVVAMGVASFFGEGGVNLTSKPRKTKREES